MELLQPQVRLTRGLIASESFDSRDAFGHGVFQKKTMLLGIIAVFVLNTQTAVIKLVAGDVDHWCQQPPDSNVSAIIWRKEFIPVEADGRPSRCHVYRYNRTELTACQEWEYNSSTAGTTVVSAWNLVCHRRVLLVAAMAAHNSGSVLALVAGPIADYLGRAPVIWVAAGLVVISTAASCFVTSYATYIVIRFWTTCFVSVNCMLVGVILFEITTHEHRPLHLIFVGSIGGGLADLWFAIMTHIDLDWALKQAIYLAPAVLSLATYFVVRESPRWLISQGNYNAAENVMFENARLNGYPLPNAASLLNKLREQANDPGQECPGDQKKAMEDCPLLRRLLIMTISCFSLMFAFYVALFFQTPGQGTLFQWVSFSFVLLAYAVMHCLIVRVPLVKVLWLCFLMMGVIQSLLAIAAYVQPTIISDVLVILSKACVYVAAVTSIAYIMELVPTAVRASALLVMFSCGRVGSVCASVFFVLQKAGREDVAFFLAAFLLFLSLLALQFLPHATEVECAKIYTRRISIVRRQAMDHMKRTLEPSKASKSSQESKKPTPRPRRTSAPKPGSL